MCNFRLLFVDIQPTGCFKNRGHHYSYKGWYNIVFDEKIKKVPITVCFSGYKGPQASEESLAFIRDQFESKNTNSEERQLYPHITQATDRDNITKVFQDVQHIVVQWSLQRSGLV